MLYIKATIERKSLLLSVKGMAQVLRAGYAHIGKYWHAHMLPKHFTLKGAREYGYQPRQGNPSWSSSVQGHGTSSGKQIRTYAARKQRKYGHQLPNVFTGSLQNYVLGGYTLRTAAKKVTVTLHGPTHLYAYRKDYNQPDKAAELTTVTAREEAVLAKELEKFIYKEAKTRRSGINVSRSIGAQAG